MGFIGPLKTSINYHIYIELLFHLVALLEDPAACLPFDLLTVQGA